MPPDLGRVIRSLKQNEVDFIVIGVSAAIAQGAREIRERYEAGLGKTKSLSDAP
jgi:septum formation inhibitor-activating ATPase MinD